MVTAAADRGGATGMRPSVGSPILRCVGRVFVDVCRLMRMRFVGAFSVSQSFVTSCYEAVARKLRFCFAVE